jgi:tetratricopeptide (TPR) repeat protein
VYWIICFSIGLCLIGCKKKSEEIKDYGNKSVVLLSHNKGYGSGFVIEALEGICTVLTAKHVVPEGAEISISTLKGKNSWKPTQIKRAASVDLAVLTFNPLDGNCPPSLELGDSSSIELEQKIYIAGYPGAVGGKTPTRQFHWAFVTDMTTKADGYGISYEAKTSVGTSGSPVFNESGEVIAVHGRSYLDGDDAGIPIDIYKRDRIATAFAVASDEANQYFEEGLEKSNKKDYQGAFISYSRSIELNPNNSGAYNNRGIIKSNLGEKEKAILDYNQSINLDSNNDHAYYNRGLAKSSLGNRQGAKEDYQQAAKLYLQQGKNKEYQKVLSLIKELK